MLPSVRFMPTLLAGCAALHIPPTRGIAKLAVARRAAVLVMDEERELVFTNVTAAAASIKEVIMQDGFMDAKASAYAEAAMPEVDFAALTEEKSSIENALLSGYDADKVKRLAEVEAMLAGAACAAPESTALSPEEAAKAAWLAKTYGDVGNVRSAAPADSNPPSPTQDKDRQVLTDEKNALDEALLSGYDAEKVKRLAEVEAMLAEAACAAPEATALSREEAAKAAWLAAHTRPSWGGKTDS